MSIQLAGCVIFSEKHGIYLLHRNKKGVTQWELPGGKIDPGEEAEDTAVRELQEELGVTVEIVRHLITLTFFENSQEFTYSYFLARIADGQPRICEPQTFDELQSFLVSELPDLQLSGAMIQLHAAILDDSTLLA